MNKDNINDPKLQKQREGILKDWLSFHYRTTIGVVIFSFLVECMMSLLFVQTDLLHTTLKIYILKFIAIPSGINFMIVIIETIVMKLKMISQKQKIFIISLLLVFICFVLYTVHSAFVSAYFIFPGAIVMTTIYASYRLTGMTAISSIVSIIGSELFIKWDIDKIRIVDNIVKMGDFLISIMILLAFSGVCMVVIRFEQKIHTASIIADLERYELKKNIKLDELTGIYNRKAFHEALDKMELSKSGESYIMAIIDLDKFKDINDTYGHHRGDACLKEFGRILKENAYLYTPYRYGGDEFCLLFYNTQMQEAIAACDRIRQEVEKFQIPESALRFTVSIGLSEYDRESDAARFFIESDLALYNAKKARNCIRVYERGMAMTDC